MLPKLAEYLYGKVTVTEIKQNSRLKLQLTAVIEPAKSPIQEVFNEKRQSISKTKTGNTNELILSNSEPPVHEELTTPKVSNRGE